MLAQASCDWHLIQEEGGGNIANVTPESLNVGEELGEHRREESSGKVMESDSIYNLPTGHIISCHTTLALERV